MAKHKRRRASHGTRPATPDKQTLLADLETRASELEGCEPAGAGPIWGQVHKLLLKTDADPAEIARLIATRDVEVLTRLMRSLAGLETEPGEGGNTPDRAGAAIPAETLKKAMRAFRRRIKLIRLDHESRLGVGPMTGGLKADFDAILPPQEFSPRVWETLADSGRLRNAGQGFYMLAEADSGA